MPNAPMRGISPRMLPAPEPGRQAAGYTDVVVWDGGGTGRSSGSVGVDTTLGIWLSRYRSWRDGFQTYVAPNLVKYWRLWRNFDESSSNSLPGNDWRDRTVDPEAFKVEATTTPRIVLAQFSGREWATVEADDENYEELVRQTNQQAIQRIGTGSREGNFYERIIEGLKYGRIMGHVWFYLGWKTDERWLKTKLPVIDPETGKRTGWQPVEKLDSVYNGLDLNWVPLDSLAINLRGPRRWAIERIITTMEALKEEDRIYREKTGESLYSSKDLNALENLTDRSGETESFEEPRDTEAWPSLNERGEELGLVPGERPIELWLCWDNQKRTLTKIAGRAVVLAHGLAPTPDGMDPYFGIKAVPVPGRVYGDSIYNWIGGLCTTLTRIKRARMDEVLLNIWQQFVYRTGAITSPRMLMRPGGAIGLDIAPGEALANAFSILPRRPVFQEAYQEAGHTQFQIEGAAGADGLSAGSEATIKSRDVSATESQIRQTMGAARWQMENLYYEVVMKKPLLERSHALLKQNLTEPMTVVMPDGTRREVTLLDLQEPVNFTVGGGIYELTKAERRKDTAELVALAANPQFAQHMNVKAILSEFFRARDWKKPTQFVLSDTEATTNALTQTLLEGGPAAQPAMAGALGETAGGGGLPGMPPELLGAGGGGAEPPEPSDGAEAMVEEL